MLILFYKYFALSEHINDTAISADDQVMGTDSNDETVIVIVDFLMIAEN